MSDISLGRWYLKKGLRRAVTLAPPALRRFGAPGVPAVRALTYHRIGRTGRDPFCVSLEDFDAQMRVLAETGLAVSHESLLGWLSGKCAAKEGAILVTLDDGFESTYRAALPVLERWGIPAVAYVTAGLVGFEPSSGPEPYMSWEQVEQLPGRGVAVGAHGFTHRSFKRMSLAECEDEAVRSRETLEQRTGTAVTSVAYPFGTRADFDVQTAEILRCAGYETAFTSQHGAIARGADAMTLPRIKVEGGEPLSMFRRLCSGGMDAWGVVDRVAWRLQQ